MKTFVEYIEYKKLEKSVIECVNLMVEMNIDPVEYILEYVSKDPEAEKCLLEYIDIQEGLWDSAVDFGKRAWGAASSVGKSLWSGGGLKYGLQHAKDIFSGPESKFNHAIKVMGDLVNSLKKGYNDPNTNQTVSFETIPGAGAAGGKSIVKWIEVLKGELEKQASQMPKLKATTVNAPQMAPRGPGAPVAAAASGSGSPGGTSSAASGGSPGGTSSAAP